MLPKYKVRLDRILAVDFELTCWPDDVAPDGQVREIIQIGICEIDTMTNSKVRSGNWYIKNTLSEISDYCTSITGITQRTLNKQGVSLQEAGRQIMKKFGSANKAWMSWGSDKQAIDRDCSVKSCPAFFSNAFYNVGLLYSMIGYDSRAIGLAEAAERLDLTFPGDAHNAQVDAEVLADVWIAIASTLKSGLGNERSNENSISVPQL